MSTFAVYVKSSGDKETHAKIASARNGILKLSPLTDRMRVTRSADPWAENKKAFKPTSCTRRRMYPQTTVADGSWKRWWLLSADLIVLSRLVTSSWNIHDGVVRSRWDVALKRRRKTWLNRCRKWSETDDSARVVAWSVELTPSEKLGAPSKVSFIYHVDSR